MPMIYLEQDGTDIPVEIVDYPTPDTVRVVSIVGWPFGHDTQYEPKNRLISRCVSSETVVARKELRVIDD